MIQRQYSLTIRLSAIALILGGTTRIIASRRLFTLFGIRELWPGNPYSLYIYRVLGGFVIALGIVLWLTSKRPDHYRLIVKGLSAGFLLLAFVMLLSGLLLKISLAHFLVDPLFCFMLACLLWWAARRR